MTIYECLKLSYASTCTPKLRARKMSTCRNFSKYHFNVHSKPRGTKILQVSKFFKVPLQRALQSSGHENFTLSLHFSCYL